MTKSQVVDFSYFNRAGTVSIATEQTAQVTRPTTPFPGQSSLAAGVGGFTPSRPDDVVVYDMYSVALHFGGYGWGVTLGGLEETSLFSHSPPPWGGIRP